MSGSLVSIDCALRNQVLAALPATDWRRLRGHLSVLDAHAGMILSESDSRLTCAYFPATSIISLLHVSVDGASTEIATIGNEGVVGVSLFLGGGTSANRVIAQSKGRIFCLRGEILKEEFDSGGSLQRVLLWYTQALMTQIAQTAVCNQRHSIDRQLCRWLLMNLDRLATEELSMTHELLANTLGVRREGITHAARKLQRAGLITNGRGLITVVDRAGVEAHCCECYGLMRRAYARRSIPHFPPSWYGDPSAGHLARRLAAPTQAW